MFLLRWLLALPLALLPPPPHLHMRCGGSLFGSPGRNEVVKRGGPGRLLYSPCVSPGRLLYSPRVRLSSAHRTLPDPVLSAHCVLCSLPSTRLLPSTRVHRYCVLCLSATRCRFRTSAAWMGPSTLQLLPIHVTATSTLQLHPRYSFQSAPSTLQLPGRPILPRCGASSEAYPA